MIDDLRYAFRMLRKSPGVTAIAMLTIALGVGANTAIFSILNAMYFRQPMAYDPGRLAWVIGRARGEYRTISYLEYQAYRAEARAFSGLAAYQDVTVALGGAEPARISGVVVSGNYFDVLGLRAAAGRTFHPDEDSVAGANPVAVIGWSLWQRLFNGDASAVGQSVIINGHVFTVVGVAPKGFSGIALDRDVPGDVVWLPIAMLHQVVAGDRAKRLLTDGRSTWFRAFGRLAPGRTADEADADVRTIAGRFAQTMPTPPEGYSATAVGIRGLQHPDRRDDPVETVVFLMGVPALILLIACANVANLLLSRAATRWREMAVRLSLGASRGRLIRQVLTESTTLALAGGAAGLVMSLWITDLIFWQIDPNMALRGAVGADWRVVAFAASVALVTGVLCGLAPAFGGSRGRLLTSLKDESAGGSSRRRSRLASGFVVAQVTASMVLLIGAGLFLRSLATAARVDVGFETRNAVTASFDLDLLGYDAARSQALYRELLERVRAVSAGSTASLISNLPLQGPDNSVQVSLAEQRAGHSAPITAGISFTWPGYFQTMEIPLLTGRDFTLHDDAGAPRAVIVNETLARRLWPDANALGGRLVPSFGRRGQNAPAYEVVGIVRDHRYRHMAEKQWPVMYLAARQQHPMLPGNSMSRMTIVARTANSSGAETRAIQSIRAMLRELDPNLPLYNVRTLREVVSNDLRESRVISTLFLSFGTLAVLLTMLGLYSVLAFAVVQRRREIGVRIALGAQRGDVLGMILRDALRLTGTGIAIGLLVSAGISQTLARFLYGVTPTDPGTFAMVALLLSTVAVVAGLLPARRAASVDPMLALRME